MISATEAKKTTDEIIRKEREQAENEFLALCHDEITKTVNSGKYFVKISVSKEFRNYTKSLTDFGYTVDLKQNSTDDFFTIIIGWNK